MPSTLRRIAISALVFASACGGGDFVAPSITAANDTYTLNTFNGQSLPAIVSADASSQTALIDDSFIFRGDGSYLERGHLRTTRNGVSTVQTLESPGTYTREGATVILANSSGTINGAFTDDTTLTIVAGSNVLVFLR